MANYSFTHKTNGKNVTKLFESYSDMLSYISSHNISDEDVVKMTVKGRTITEGLEGITNLSRMAYGTLNESVCGRKEIKEEEDLDDSEEALTEEEEVEDSEEVITESEELDDDETLTEEFDEYKLAKAACRAANKEIGKRIWYLDDEDILTDDDDIDDYLMDNEDDSDYFNVDEISEDDSVEDLAGRLVNIYNKVKNQ